MRLNCEMGQEKLLERDFLLFTKEMVMSESLIPRFSGTFYLLEN